MAYKKAVKGEDYGYIEAGRYVKPTTDTYVPKANMAMYDQMNNPGKLGGFAPRYVPNQIALDQEEYSHARGRMSAREYERDLDAQLRDRDSDLYKLFYGKYMQKPVGPSSDDLDYDLNDNVWNEDDEFRAQHGMSREEFEATQPRQGQGPMGDDIDSHIARMIFGTDLAMEDGVTMEEEPLKKSSWEYGPNARGAHLGTPEGAPSVFNEVGPDGSVIARFNKFGYPIREETSPDFKGGETLSEGAGGLLSGYDIARKMAAEAAANRATQTAASKAFSSGASERAVNAVNKAVTAQNAARGATAASARLGGLGLAYAGASRTDTSSIGENLAELFMGDTGKSGIEKGPDGQMRPRYGKRYFPDLYSYGKERDDHGVFSPQSGYNALIGNFDWKPKFVDGQGAMARQGSFFERARAGASNLMGDLMTQWLRSNLGASNAATFGGSDALLGTVLGDELVKLGGDPDPYGARSAVENALLIRDSRKGTRTPYENLEPMRARPSMFGGFTATR